MPRQILLLTAMLAAASLPSYAFEVMIQYPVVPDQPAGFNDLTDGAARKLAFERAIEIWKTQLQGDVTVTVRAFFGSDAFFGGSGGALGVGKPTSAWANLGGLPYSTTFYYGALASQLTATNLPATAGDAVGTHLQVIFNDRYHSNLPIWWYELDNPPTPDNVSFVTEAMHEVAHGLGMLHLVQVSPNSIHPGAWVNTVIEPVPTEPTTLPFGDIYSRFLTRTPPGGGVNDKDFFDMSNAERYAASTSGEVYFFGANVKAAAEFTPPPAMPAPLINFKGEVQIYAPATPAPLSALGHWEEAHVNQVLMKPTIPTGIDLRDIDATRELMQDLGWGLNPPPAAGSLAIVYVDFDFDGEEFGTEALPVNTVAEAVDLVMDGGLVYIQPGTSSETLTIPTAMTLNAVTATVSIGVP